MEALRVKGGMTQFEFVRLNEQIISMLHHDSGVISLIQQLNSNREEIANQIQKLREISIDINTNLQNSKKVLEQTQVELDDFSLKFASIVSDQKSFQQVIEEF